MGRSATRARRAKARAAAAGRAAAGASRVAPRRRGRRVVGAPPIQRSRASTRVHAGSVMVAVCCIAEHVQPVPYGKFGGEASCPLVCPRGSVGGSWSACSAFFVYQFFVVGGPQASNPSALLRLCVLLPLPVSRLDIPV